MTYSDLEWWERANCGPNPAVFEPADMRRGPRKRGRDWAAARARCAECPVQRECLRYTLDHPPSYAGDELFAAGYTPEQLRELRKRLNERRRRGQG